MVNVALLFSKVGNDEQPADVDYQQSLLTLYDMDLLFTRSTLAETTSLPTTTLKPMSLASAGSGAERKKSEDCICSKRSEDYAMCGRNQNQRRSVGRCRLALARPGASSQLPDYPLRQLQRALGNRAFGQFIQAKLEVSQPDDTYEQEADHVADQVTRRQDAPAGSNDSPPNIQRKCLHARAAAPVLRVLGKRAELAAKTLASITPLQRQANEEEEEEATLQTKSVSGASSVAGTRVENQVKGLNGGGAPLPQSARSFSSRGLAVT